MKEIWKKIENYKGLYEVSDAGKIRSAKQNLNPVLTTAGYPKVKLCRDGNVKSMLVHRLVAIAFLDNPENKPQVNHKDGDKTNNNVNNLEWCTASENMKHAFATKLNVTLTGENHPSSKLSNSDVVNIKSLKGKVSYLKISKMYNVNFYHIRDIMRGKSRVEC